uniref:tRNA-splicing endonuclease subunit Sen34 n=1 Tax=Dendroctonus ponderosae TaxID=77166 RepID=A0AAR5PXN1_DENPD
MIKLIFVHGNIFVYDIEDWSALRKAHRIVGNIIGSTSSIPSLPLKLMPEEALLLVEKELASIWENRNTASELPDPAANLEDSLLEAQQKEYRQLRKRQLLCLIDNIVEKRRSMGDHRSKEEILNDEINKSSTVTKENMIWPIFLKDPIQSLSAISTDLISSQTTTLRLVIFKDLWQRGYYITSGEKFGGHFLVYFGDPVTYHAIFIVKCVDSETTFSPTELISFGRLGVSVRKRAVLASIKNGKASYMTINWIDA